VIISGPDLHNVPDRLHVNDYGAASVMFCVYVGALLVFYFDSRTADDFVS
jgi:hypothetical protein